MDNHWLASLNAEDQERIAPHLHDAGFTRGQTLYDAGEAVGEIWFPSSGVVSLMTLIDGNRMVETAAIGREGLVGVTCGPMNARAISRAIAQTDGDAVCLPMEKFLEVLEASEVSAELERRGLIRRRRGRIEVLDREGLRAAACDCYDTIRQVMDNLHIEGAPGRRAAS